jgi:restriction system protein
MATPTSRHRFVGARLYAPMAILVAVAAAMDLIVRHLHAGGTMQATLDGGALALSVAGVLALLGLPASLRRNRAMRSGIAEVDSMSGEEFERRLASLFVAMGYDVVRTGGSGDFGADLVVARRGGADRAVVQAKRYDGPVGIEAVQQVVGAARYYDADDAFVVTNSTCTPAAGALAAAGGVRLVDRDALTRLLAAYPEGGEPRAVLLRQLVDGLRLLVYGIGRALWLGWRVVRLLGRGVGARR